MFAGWVAYFLLCVIPMQIVMAVTWGSARPAAAARVPQPVRGVLLTMFSLVAGAVVAALALAIVGARVTPPAPILAHWVIVSVPVTFLAVIMWGGWPFTKVIKHPVAAGLVAIGLVAFYVGVNVMHMDVVHFLVAVPVPFIFGSIIVLNMLQNSLFASMKQPLKGIANTIAIAVFGVGLSWIYGLLAPTVTGTLNAGPPAYDFEIWLASSLLSVTFPFLIFYAEFFQYWPLAAAQRTEAARTTQAAL